MEFERLNNYYRGKRVLLTGHTGFKGSWMTVLLSLLGAEVYGYALQPPTKPSLFGLLYGEDAGAETRQALWVREGAGGTIADAKTAEAKATEGSRIGLQESHIGDIRDFAALEAFYQRVQPDIVFHLAAQPIVLESYRAPRETYETNVMGTVNLLDCLRRHPGCRSFLNVTTDKVYRNEEKAGYGYREEDQLDGYDPYSNSKSCSELVTHSYRSAFLEEAGVAVSTARAGNVIGGGDFAADRILPDCVRAAADGRSVHVRNPYSTRPYQHVLEPLVVYLTIAMLQAEDEKAGSQYAGWYNVGPDDCDCVTTGELVGLFAKHWGRGFCWEGPAGDASAVTAAPAAVKAGGSHPAQKAPHEASFLKLDNTKVKRVLGWKPVWHIDEAVEATVAWSKAWLDGGAAAANAELLRQVRAYFL